jgi:hypothetical protein
MQMDFYSQEELSIQIDFSGRYPMPENRASVLRLFACFTLRQLSNLGQHLTAKALAGLLVSQSTTLELMGNLAALPSGAELLRALHFHVVSVLSETQPVQETMRASLAIEEKLHYAKPIMDALDSEIMARMPNLIEYRGKGKRSFEVILPPFRLNMKGFGILGADANHHAFHSVAGLIRFLGKEPQGITGLKSQLPQVAALCGSAYVFDQIPMDQVPLANAILTKIGIS